jgi:hypothetical protein
MASDLVKSANDDLSKAISASLAPTKARLTKQAIGEAMRRWAAAYRQTLTRDVIETYWHALACFEDSDVRVGMARAVAEEDFAATPAKVGLYCQQVQHERFVKLRESQIREWSHPSATNGERELYRARG